MKTEKRIREVLEFKQECKCKACKDFGIPILEWVLK